jgi:transcriptional regulator with PAS, ATPase and Fis domain
MGLFELTSGGTFFFDEVNSMAVGLQAKCFQSSRQHRYLPPVAAL